MRARRGLAIALLVLSTAVAASLAPLWTYALSLALFGFPHVLAELRYVDERFGARLGRATSAWLALGLLGIALLRVLALGGFGTSAGRCTVELVVGALLVGSALPLVRARGGSPLPVVLVATALFAGAFAAPLTTLVGLALLHNLTPVGFLVERLRGPARSRALLAAAAVFGVVPAVMLGGGMATVQALLSVDPTPSGPPGIGDVDLHLPAFVPEALLASPHAVLLFAVAAYLQCMHYAVVLHVLPRLSGGSETAGARLRWPQPLPFAAGVVVGGLLFTLGFRGDFATTRGVYAVFAAVHAWLEIPVLVLACSVLPVAQAAPETCR